MNNKKGHLGRGLAALMEDESSIEAREVSVDQILPNPYQPRKTFNQEKFDELVQSIKTQGIIQPIVITPMGENGKYYIVVGERRWRAAKELKMEKVPAIIKNLEKKEIMEAALIENIQREDLNVVEMAEAFKRLMEEFTYTQEELGGIVGRSRSSVANVLRILKLPEEIKNALREGKITEGHARALLAVESDKEREKLFQKMLQSKITVRQAEKKAQKKREKDVNLQAIEEKLSQMLKTKVNIVGRKKKGKLIIEYYSLEQLEEIILKLEGESNE